MFLHPTYVVAPNRKPLGVIDLWRWAREFRDEDGVRPEDILESDRWIEGHEGVAKTAVGLPDTCSVYVADREADIVSVMARAAELEHPADWLIRTKHDRTLPNGGKLRISVPAEKPIGEIRFILVARRVCSLCPCTSNSVCVCRYPSWRLPSRCTWWWLGISIA